MNNSLTKEQMDELDQRFESAKARILGTIERIKELNPILDVSPTNDAANRLFGLVDKLIHA